MSEDEKLRLIWHVGFQKTGTTLFQKTMALNRIEIGQFVTVFPKSGYTREIREAFNSYWRAGKEIALEKAAAGVKNLVRVVEESGCKTALISDENLVGYSVYFDDGDCFTRSATICKTIEEAAGDHHCEFVFYVRDFDSWLRSAHNQDVKRMGCVLDFDEWYSKVPFEKSWDVQLQSLRSSVKSPVKFVELGCEEDDGFFPGWHLLEDAGFPRSAFDSLKEADSKNESLSSGGLEFMRRLNELDIPPQVMRSVRSVVIKNRQCFK